MTVDDDLDDLYGVAPADFLARRKELVAAAKKRGDSEGARLIGGSRRPTAAAWVVNSLVRRDPTARPRLTELTASLKAAHAAMDGARIRELTATQRRLVDALVRAGLAATGHADAAAALRNDVTDTLQAAIADPDVASRLGRLEKAERWSGFGDFGSVTTVGAPRRAPTTPAPKGPDPADDAARQAATKRRADASARVQAAEAALREARDVEADRRAAVATARRRYEELLETLGAAEREVDTADAEADAARSRARDAEKRLEEANGELAQAESGLSDSPPAPTAARIRRAPRRSR